MNFDIDQLDETSETSYRVVVGRNPDVDGAPGEDAGFLIVGPNSTQFQDVEREISVLNLLQAEKRKRALDLGNAEDARLFVDGNADRRELLVKRCTIGWFGLKQNGQDADFTPANLDRVLKSRPAWVKRIAGEIETLSNFDKG